MLVCKRYRQRLLRIRPRLQDLQPRMLGEAAPVCTDKQTLLRTLQPALPSALPTSAYVKVSRTPASEGGAAHSGRCPRSNKARSRACSGGTAGSFCHTLRPMGIGLRTRCWRRLARAAGAAARDHEHVAGGRGDAAHEASAGVGSCWERRTMMRGTRSTVAGVGPASAVRS